MQSITPIVYTLVVYRARIFNTNALFLFSVLAVFVAENWDSSTVLMFQSFAALINESHLCFSVI